MRIFFLIGISVLSVLPACRKDKTITGQPGATVVIESPLPGQEFRKGTNVTIRAKINGDVNLHGYEVFIVDRQSSDTVFKAGDHGHARQMQVNEVWIDTLSGASELTVYVKTEINHEGAVVMEDVSISTRE